MAEYVSKSTLYALCGQRGITYLHVSDIDNMPAADVAPVRHGRWVKRVMAIHVVQSARPSSYIFRM